MLLIDADCITHFVNVHFIAAKGHPASKNQMLPTIVVDIISIATSSVTIEIRTKRDTAVVAETASAAKITVQAKRLITLADVAPISVEIE